MTVGLLHPGAMGATVGSSCRDDVVWCSDGRSDATRERAQGAGFTDAASLDALVERSDVIISVCPPGDALALAYHVAAFDFDGIYVDANAVAPSTARTIGDHFDRFVDAGIVGPPAHEAGTTRMYLSGDGASEVAERWGGPLDVRVIDGGAGAASALKMAYASWTKVSAALLLDVRALARAEGVDDALLDEWAVSQPGAAARAEAAARSVAPKAWRFVGEMEQMTIAYAEAGLPNGFAAGAAELYRRLGDLKEVDLSGVDLDTVIATLLANRPA